MPGAAGDLAEEYPDVWKAYAALGKASAESLSEKGLREVEQPPSA
jgi:hypothetical protein